MISHRHFFLQHIAQTSELPAMIEVVSSDGINILAADGKQYIDLISGICVSSTGHRHPRVIEAIKTQADRYLHTMVYGEHVQSPQVEYAKEICQAMGNHFESVYFLSAGTEATEVAMKIAKKFTGRSEFISCSNAYHGSTQGAESLRSDEAYTRHFTPLLPGIKHMQFNNRKDLEKINHSTAGVIMEPVQAEAGIRTPDTGYLLEVKSRCQEKGAIFILDEIQTGFGRTGHLFAFQKYEVVPDIVLLGKAMGGGLPLSAAVSSKEIMQCLIKNPALGHITTFGGHPLCCAAGLAAFKVLNEEALIKKVPDKTNLFLEHLKHPIIKEIRHSGLMMAIELRHRKYLKYVVEASMHNGVIVDYFLFDQSSFRIAPPLVIGKEDILKACTSIRHSLDKAYGHFK